LDARPSLELLLSAYWSGPEVAANLVILLHLLVALLVGGVLGYERTFHGRAAGMRTYSLVCLASTALTVLGGYPELWYAASTAGGATRVLAPDPTRVIQGIMTGIGFLGAGVIVRDGMSTRGLSTAASVWMTASIGVLIGIGFLIAALSAAAMALLVMSGVRLLEMRLPRRGLLHLRARFPREQCPSAAEMRALVARFGFDAQGLTYELHSDGRGLEYRMSLVSRHPGEGEALAAELLRMSDLLGFRLSPLRD
jgi:putative Mg2+ transporter-C (MgtC) family protein